MSHSHTSPYPRHVALWLGLALHALHAAPPPEPRFQAIDVDTHLAIGYGIAVADMDGDQRPDILVCDKNQVAWYRNPGWEKHVMAENLTPQDHVCIAAQDIDGDGRAEVAVGAGWNPGDTLNSGAVFYLEPAADRTQRWKPVPLPHEPTVHRMRWAKDAAGRWGLVVVPLHGRGNQDGNGVGARIQRHTPPGAGQAGWRTELIDASLHKVHNFDPVQWDTDVAHEFLLGSKEGWFLADGSKDGPRLDPLGSALGGGVGEIRLGHGTAGRRFVATVEPMHGHALVLYTPPAPGTPGTAWARRVLDESLVDGHALACGDLLGIGRDQVVVGWRAMNRPGARVGIRMFTPMDPDGKEWRATAVDDNAMACEDLCLADLDGDGRLDVVAAGRATHNLKVYRNLRP